MVESEKVEIQLLNISCCEEMVVCNSHHINGEDVGSLDFYFLGLFFEKKKFLWRKIKYLKQFFYDVDIDFSDGRMRC